MDKKSFNGQTEYSRLQGHGLSLGAPVRRGVLWAIKTDWNNNRPLFPNAIDTFQQSIGKRTTDLHHENTRVVTMRLTVLSGLQIIQTLVSLTKESVLGPVRSHARASSGQSKWWGRRIIFYSAASTLARIKSKQETRRRGWLKKLFYMLPEVILASRG